jgi:PAS domain S-box-containing protein
MEQASKLKSVYARSLIEASRDPLVTISPEGKITDMNEALTRITGQTREQLTGTDFFTYFTDAQKAREVYEEVFAKGFVSDYPLTIRDRHLTDVLFNGSVYKDESGNVLGAVVVARDITEQMRTQTELIEAKVFAELAARIAEDAKLKAESATKIAEEATRLAESAVKAKQQFLSNMSHEIRTPMNAILGFTKVVLKTSLSPRQREYLNAIKTSGDALIVLINDILDLAKVDAGKMTFEQAPFKLAESISSMLHLFKLKIEEKNLRLVRIYDERIPPILLGDAVRLHQVILNLVSNAVKFTNEGEITVSVRLLSEDEEKVTIEFAVQDTGIGIPEDRISSIFENFQQATSETSRLYGGTGLGLAIVKQLIELQDGKITVASVPAKGSTFSFTLNFNKTTIEIESETACREPDQTPHRISALVVEDIPLNQLLMQTLLDEFGFACDIAANGKIATDMLQRKTYDVILMDLQMPEMNGFQATEYIRNTLRLSTPIIALTADVTTTDLAKCTEVGMNDYISKPVNERQLHAKISAAVRAVVVALPAAAASSASPRYTNMKFLADRTRSRPELMLKMIHLFMEQTPVLIQMLKRTMREQNWIALQSTAHKMIPSFSIVGMSVEYERMAKKLQDYDGNPLQEENMHAVIRELDQACILACTELNEEYLQMQKIKS